MRHFLLAALLLSSASAQPPGPPGPPGPSGKPPAPTASPSPGGAANLSLPHVVGKLKGFSPTRFTIQREMGSGGPTAKGEGYPALAALGCPEGSNPETLLISLPNLK